MMEQIKYKKNFELTCQTHEVTIPLRWDLLQQAVTLHRFSTIGWFLGFQKQSRIYCDVKLKLFLNPA